MKTSIKGNMNFGGDKYFGGDREPSAKENVISKLYNSYFMLKIYPTLCNPYIQQERLPSILYLLLILSCLNNTIR